MSARADLNARRYSLRCCSSCGHAPPGHGAALPRIANCTLARSRPEPRMSGPPHGMLPCPHACSNAIVMPETEYDHPEKGEGAASAVGILQALAVSLHCCQHFPVLSMDLRQPHKGSTAGMLARLATRDRHPTCPALLPQAMRCMPWSWPCRSRSSTLTSCSTCGRCVSVCVLVCFGGWVASVQPAAPSLGASIKPVPAGATS